MISGADGPAVRVAALHGFLGLPSDWNFLRGPGIDVDAIDVFHNEIPAMGDILAGYSMGGRLALRALLSGACYRAAIFLSTRVTDPEPGRRESDEVWAERFENDEWSALMADWNRQPVFSGDAMPRYERDFDRQALALALREWSPAALPSVLGNLREIHIPTLWLAGARDEKYVEEARLAAARVAGAESEVIPAAGHRLLFEQPDRVREAIRRFLKSLPS